MTNAAADTFQEQLLNQSGFTTPARRALRSAVLERINKDAELWERCWPYTDAYGPAGEVPAQGYDWSGFRDSSYTAINAMARELGIPVQGVQ